MTKQQHIYFLCCIWISLGFYHRNDNSTFDFKTRLSGLIPFVSNEIQTEPKKRTKKDRNVTFDMECFLAGIIKKQPSLVHADILIIKMIEKRL